MVSTSPTTPSGSDVLTIGGRTFQSRLFTGTGKYSSMDMMQNSIERSGCEMVTVAVRRVQTVAAGHAGLMKRSTGIASGCSPTPPDAPPLKKPYG